MKVAVKHGDLIEEPASFIVNASNTELTLGSGVSKAFRDSCGGNYFQQILFEVKKEYLKDHPRIEQGDVLLSGSGNCKNFKYALHAAWTNTKYLR
ncbi:MAG: macro domain-containing protein [Sulfurimonas sp.]